MNDPTVIVGFFLIMKIVKKVEQTVQHWSGGETRELYIYPPDASFEDRTFLYRISTARVDLDESSFTKFDGFERILIPLNNSVSLSFNGGVMTEVKKGESIQFSGEWETISKGKVEDFNVIFHPTVHPSIALQSYRKGDVFPVLNQNELFVFIVSGELLMNKEKIDTGDFVRIDACEEVEMKVLENCTLIFVGISLE